VARPGPAAHPEQISLILRRSVDPRPPTVGVRARLVGQPGTPHPRREETECGSRQRTSPRFEVGRLRCVRIAPVRGGGMMLRSIAV
jgi:hypothetical protein